MTPEQFLDSVLPERMEVKAVIDDRAIYWNLYRDKIRTILLTLIESGKLVVKEDV